MDNEHDENGNNPLRFVLGQFTPEQRAFADSFHSEKSCYKPISPSYYEATSSSMDYIDNAIINISNLLNERKTGLNDGDHRMVLVWDIGEITTVSVDHFAQIYVFHHQTNAQSLLEISKSVIEKTKFCHKFDFLNVVNIEDVDDAESEEMKEHVPMYEALEKFYNEITDGMRDDGPLISYELIERCGLVHNVRGLYFGAIQLQRLFHQRWKTARKCLEMINKQSLNTHRKYANVVLCENGIGVGVGQLLISGHSKYIPIENIYSLRKTSKEMVFERIQKRFGEKCVLVYVTSRPETASFPENLQIPIWEVKANDSIEHLSNALQNNLFR